MQNRHKIFFGLSVVILIIFILTINTTIESFEDKYKSQEIVIARYNENLEWINEEPFNRHPIIVYNKSDNYDFSKNNITQIINLPNIGRETHSYLYHIVKNYDNLKEVTIFLPGSVELPNKFERSKNVIKTVEEVLFLQMKKKIHVLVGILFLLSLERIYYKNRNHIMKS